MAVAAGAPLAVGGVHRPIVIGLISTTLVGIALLFGAARARGQSLRTGTVVLIPLVFLAIPCIQSVPLPFSARNVIDPRGSAILAEGLLGPRPTMPLSLDPPATRVKIGEAAAALALFVAGFHFASGHRRRHLLLRAIGMAGVASVTIGIGHRLFGVAKIYGLFATTKRTMFIGPFVNPNHAAEFLNLAAFVCLACSFQRPTMLNRVGWLVATGLCFGGTAATLSRGGALATVAGMLVFLFLRNRAKDESAEPAVVGRRRTSLAWAALLVGLAVLAAGAFGASELIGRFQTDHFNQDLRLRVWKDSFQIIRAHPFGIGRGAFDRVYPIYRTIKTNFPVRFAFVENELLQMLIDGGWIAFFLSAAAVGWGVWQIAVRGRRDRIEAALVAALFAVMLQNCVDFGLETTGILLPFAAILGTTLGRLRPEDEREPRWRGWPLAVVTCAALLVGGISVAHASNDDFDAVLRRNPNPNKVQVLERAQRIHPTDYYYVLAYARLLPLRSAGGPSPRFHALNRALTLCASCEQVHAEVARNLWAMGLRRQALQEWRTAVSLQPVLLRPALVELHAGGARPAELASIATFDPDLLIQVAEYLASLSRSDQALTVLDEAEILGVGPKDLLLVRAQMQIFGHDERAAAVTVAKARQAGIQSPRLDVLEAKVAVATRGPEGVDGALEILDRAADRYPQDVEIQRVRLALVVNNHKWRAAERSLDGFKRALSLAGNSAGEAHIAAARIDTQLSRWTNALDEYRIALADSPNDIGLWIEFGQAALTAGRNTVAREAFMTADHLSPNNPEIAKAFRALDSQADVIRVGRP